MYLLEQQPDNQTTTEISIKPWGIALIIGLIIFFIVGIMLLVKHANKDAGTDEQGQGGPHKKPFKWGVVIAVVIACTLVIVPIFVNKTSTSNKVSMITRDIRGSDYTYTTSQDLTSYQITIVPERDINSCTISLMLYDKNDKSLFSDTMTKYDLAENKSYTYTFEFGFINSLSGNHVEFNITGKCDV